jgi:hypothetical protein
VHKNLVFGNRIKRNSFNNGLVFDLIFDAIFFLYASLSLYEGVSQNKKVLRLWPFDKFDKFLYYMVKVKKQELNKNKYIYTVKIQQHYLQDYLFKTAYLMEMFFMLNNLHKRVKMF